MKKLILFTIIVTTNLCIQTSNKTETEETLDQDETLMYDANGNPIAKNQITENMVLKILQEENERLAREIHIQQNSHFFAQSCIFGTGFIAGLLLGIIIHLKLKIDHTDSMLRQLFDFIKLIQPPKDNQ